MSTPLYIGMGPPYVIRATIAKTPDFDPAVAATAVEIVFLVTKAETGNEVSWPAAVVAQTADLLTLEHELAVPDLDERGAYTVWARCTLPSGGVLRTIVGKLPVVLNRNQVAS